MQVEVEVTPPSTSTRDTGKIRVFTVEPSLSHNSPASQVSVEPSLSHHTLVARVESEESTGKEFTLTLQGSFDD